MNSLVLNRWISTLTTIDKSNEDSDDTVNEYSVSNAIVHNIDTVSNSDTLEEVSDIPFDTECEGNHVICCLNIIYQDNPVHLESEQVLQDSHKDNSIITAINHSNKHLDQVILSIHDTIDEQVDNNNEEDTEIKDDFIIDIETNDENNDARGHVPLKIDQATNTGSIVLISQHCYNYFIAELFPNPSRNMNQFGIKKIQ